MTRETKNIVIAISITILILLFIFLGFSEREVSDYVIFSEVSRSMVADYSETTTEYYTDDDGNLRSKTSTEYWSEPASETFVVLSKNGKVISGKDIAKYQDYGLWYSDYPQITEPQLANEAHFDSFSESQTILCNMEVTEGKKTETIVISAVVYKTGVMKKGAKLTLKCWYGYAYSTTVGEP